MLLQVLDQSSGTYAWPPIILRVVTAFVGIGFLAALVLAWSHDEKGQQRVLEQMEAQRDASAVWANFPFFDPLRSNPRYQALLAKMGLR